MATAVLDQFADLAKDFDFMDFANVVKVPETLEEYGVTSDLALRQALKEAGIPVLATPGIKRRHQDQALHEATLCVIDGYNVTRCILGTWRRPVKYTFEAAQIKPNCNRLLKRGQEYEWDILMRSMRGPALDAFTGMTDIKGTFLDKILGHRIGQATRFAMMLEGMRLALAEEEMFNLRSQITA